MYSTVSRANYIVEFKMTSERSYFKTALLAPIGWVIAQGAGTFATIGFIIALCHFMPRLVRWLYKAYAPSPLRSIVERFRDFSPFIYRLLFVALPGNMPLFLWIWLHRTESLPMDFGLLISQYMPSILLFTVLPAVILDFARAIFTKFLFHLRLTDPVIKKVVRCLAYVVSPCDMTEISGPKIVDENRPQQPQHEKEKPVVVEKIETKRAEGLKPAQS
jgi:hypothetical protein